MIRSIVGVAMSDNSTETVNAPITPIARGFNVSAPDPTSYASGSMPSAAASDVINTGRSHRRPDFTNASSNEFPAA